MMSALLVRLATVQALRNVTTAKERVFDSSLLKFDLKLDEEKAPTITVYTDEMKFDAVEGRSLGDTRRSLALVIEVGVAQRVTVEGPENGKDEIITLPVSDEGLELAIDIICRQIVGALTHSAAPWSELWRSLNLSIEKVEVRRALPDPQGVKFAAKQMIWWVEPLSEPGFGQAAADSAWSDFFDLARTGEDEELRLLVPMLEAIFKGEDCPDWRTAQGLLGLTLDGARGIGIAPAFYTATEAAPLAAAATIVDEEGGDLVVTPEPDA